MLFIEQHVGGHATVYMSIVGVDCRVLGSQSFARGLSRAHTATVIPTPLTCFARVLQNSKHWIMTSFLQILSFDTASVLLSLQRVAVCGHCLVTLSLTINETLK